TVVQSQLVVSLQNTYDPYARKTASCIERFEALLRNQFQMNLPSYYVTIYAVEDPSLVRVFARELHGVNLSPGSVAYSVYDDLSMVGAAGPEHCGSIAHELVHLMIRQSFGNSSPWLEEGLASEVAVASPKFAALSFQRSWRDDMLLEQ